MCHKCTDVSKLKNYRDQLRQHDQKFVEIQYIKETLLSEEITEKPYYYNYHNKVDLLNLIYVDLDKDKGLFSEVTKKLLITYIRKNLQDKTAPFNYQSLYTYSAVRGVADLLAVSTTASSREFSELPAYINARKATEELSEKEAVKFKRKAFWKGYSLASKECPIHKLKKEEHNSVLMIELMKESLRQKSLENNFYEIVRELFASSNRDFIMHQYQHRPTTYMGLSYSLTTSDLEVMHKTFLIWLFATGGIAPILDAYKDKLDDSIYWETKELDVLIYKERHAFFAKNAFKWQQRVNAQRRVLAELQVKLQFITQFITAASQTSQKFAKLFVDEIYKELNNPTSQEPAKLTEEERIPTPVLPAFMETITSPAMPKTSKAKVTAKKGKRR